MSHPTLTAPAGAVDTHMHIIYPASRYPVAPGNEVFPEYSVTEYLNEIGTGLGIDRCVVAQTPRYAHDHRCVIAAVAELGPRARGTVCLPGDVTAAQVEALHAQGMRGAAFHMLPGGASTWDEIPKVAAVVADFGWHVQVQLDGTTLPDHRDVLSGLPSTLVIDHCGKFLQPGGTSHAGFAVLQDLVAAGNTYVKLSAAYESTWDDPPFMADSGAIASALIAAAPDRCMWASNWPHLASKTRDTWPDDAVLLDTLLAWTDDEAARTKILVDNPARVYGF